MGFFLIVLIVSILVLGGIAYFSEKLGGSDRENAPLTLLPGDIKYESQDGNFRFYFPITTSIVLSVVLSAVMWLFS